MGNEYGKRFIRSKAFAKFYYKNAVSSFACKTLEEEEIYSYEQFKLFRPSLRLKWPKEMVEFQTENDRFNDTPENTPESWPTEWESLYRFYYYERCDWNANISDSISSRHPFENISNTLNFFSMPNSTDSIPEQSEFLHEFQCRDRNFREPLIIDYYHYWQIHLLDSIRRENQSNMLIFGPIKETKEGLPCNDTVLSCKGVYFVNSSQIYAVSDEYNALSEFIVFSTRLIQKIARKEKHANGHFVMSDADWSEYKDKLAEFGKEILSEYNLSKDQMIAFAKFLTRLYKDYECNYRSELSNLVIQDLINLFDLMNSCFDINLSDFRIEIPELDKIFPNNENKLKENTRIFFENQLQCYNEILTTNLTTTDIQIFLTYCDWKGYYGLFESIHKLNSDWNNNTNLGSTNLYSYIRQLTGFCEELLRDIANSVRLGSKEESTKKLMYFECLKKVFQSSSFWESFDKIRTDLNQYRNDIAMIIDQIFKIDNIDESTNSNYSAVISINLLSYFLRNHCAHNFIPLENLDDRNYFKKIIIHLFNEIIFLWDEVIKNNHFYGLHSSLKSDFDLSIETGEIDTTGLHFE
ncbi:MAG: hypothetical protein CVV64_18625 [Candidatus Wallbacteria bacterium HGW-Wallbacteria-1]|uniref:Uncharacterized protein n=1 Tax=Candidatus Wallbacteria bacterium HGW-Wallbacteria-1 TaxID=2013854 RepID=A0A2N1PJH8_9BACT|nr:MAG: hypothetical protein CVV64_18625 [Candidatus Wallbacteria bacterium HGW-Wallbacteria-1]